MKHEYVYSDMSLHALDVEEAARALRHYIERENETGAREALLRICRYSDRLQSDLSSLDYRVQCKREEAELKRNPLPHTLPLALDGGAS